MDIILSALIDFNWAPASGPRYTWFAPRRTATWLVRSETRTAIFGAANPAPAAATMTARRAF
jgi:hypothetical protein